VAAFSPVIVTAVSLAAFVEAPKFWSRMELVEVGTVEAPDCESTA
jgi:hypothetical protein